MSDRSSQRPRSRTWVESNIRATQRGRYRYAVELQGFAFTELRTPPDGLGLGERPPGLSYSPGPVDDAERMHVLPPEQLFGDDRHPDTARVLKGKSGQPWP